MRVHFYVAGQLGETFLVQHRKGVFAVQREFYGAVGTSHITYPAEIALLQVNVDFGFLGFLIWDFGLFFKFDGVFRTG